MKQINNNKGMALIAALVILLAMTALGLTMFFRSVVDYKVAGNERQGIEAYYVAQAGLHDAKTRLKLNTSDTRGSALYNATDPDWAAVVSDTLPNGGTYSSRITHVREKEGSDWVVKNDDTTNNMPAYRITTTAEYQDSKRVFEEVVILDSDIVAPWGKALVACGSVYVNNNARVDSYSSTNPYDPATNMSYDGDIYSSGAVYLDNNALVGGNVTTPGELAVTSNAEIIGNAISGMDMSIESGAKVHNDATAVGNITNDGTIVGAAEAGGSITGSGTAGSTTPNSSVPAVQSPPECSEASREAMAPPTDISTNFDNSATTVVCSDPDNCSAGCQTGGACIVTNNEPMTLTGGTEDDPRRYYFTELYLSNNTNIITTGYVEIYVEGNLTIRNNAAICGNVTADECRRSKDGPSDSKPEEVLVHVFGESGGLKSSVTIRNNATLYGLLYAPDVSDFEFWNNADIHGAAIVGKDSGDVMMKNNTEIHYDVELGASISEPSPQGWTVSQKRECFYGLLANADKEYAAGSCKER